MWKLFACFNQNIKLGKETSHDYWGKFIQNNKYIHYV